jgi:hypothetical protein
MFALDSPPATAFFLAHTLARALAAQWLVVPELAFVPSLYPDLNQPMQKYLLERFVHTTNALLYSWLVLHYASKPKMWSENKFGWLLLLMLSHHVFEQLTHEIFPKTDLAFLWGNTVWTTYAVIIIHSYCFVYGYYDTFLRLAAEPFFVFMAVVVEMTEAHLGFISNWTLGNPLREEEKRTGYLTTEHGMPYGGRVALFLFVNLALGLVARQYFKVHEDAQKSTKNEDAQKSTKKKTI